MSKWKGSVYISAGMTIRTGDTEPEFSRKLGEKALKEGALAHAGRARDDQRAEEIRKR